MAAFVVNKKQEFMLKNFIAVMAGGAIGAALRYGVSLIAGGWKPFSLPAATMIVNIAGCFVLGLILGFIVKNSSLSQTMVLLLTTGFCGALTTFSTFTAETATLMDNGKLITGLIYIVLSIILGYLAFALGRYIIK